jgi:hypothetical protein
LPIISQYIHFCKHYVIATKNGQDNLYIVGSQLYITEQYDFWYAVRSRKEILIHGNLDLYMFEYYRVPSNLSYCEWCDPLCNNHLATPFAAFLLWPSKMCYTQKNVPYIGIYNHQKQKKFWSKHTIFMTNCKRTLQTNP